MSKQLPSRPNIRHLKNQAKQLCKDYKAGLTEAIDRIKAYLPDANKSAIAQAACTLQDAQLVIAREYGFSSWPKLTYAVIGGHYPDRAARMRRPGLVPERMYVTERGKRNGRDTYMPDPLFEGQSRQAEWVDGHAVWSLFQACTAGDLELVNTLLREEPKLINARWQYDLPIRHAVRQNHPDVVRALLEAGADPGIMIFAAQWEDLMNIARERGFDEVLTILQETIMGRFGYDVEFGLLSEFIKLRDRNSIENLLKEKPHLVTATDAAGSTGLHWAVMTRQLDLVDRFLDLGVDIDVQRADGLTPLMLSLVWDYIFRKEAHRRGLLEGVTTTPEDDPQHLLDRGAYYDICTACRLKDRARVKQVLADDPSTARRDSSGHSPLVCAASTGDLDLIQTILKAGPDLFAMDQALFAAAASNQLKIAELLLRQGANANHCEDSSGVAIWIAREHNPDNYHAMEALLQRHGAVEPSFEPDPDGIKARMADDADYVPDIGTIIYIMDDGHEDVIDLILQRDPHMPSRLIEASHYRSFGDKPGMARTMLAHGLDPDFRSGDRTLLLNAVQAGHTTVAEVLIEAGADVNAMDVANGETSLAIAARAGHVALIKMLLDAGADPNLADWPWSKPLIQAEKAGHVEIAAFLRDHGARG